MPLDRLLQRPLVIGAGAGNPARQDLGPLRDELLQELDVLVIDVVDLVGDVQVEVDPRHPASQPAWSIR
mgnify:CR=1 FL=1